MDITTWQGDITTLDLDAIVNAANRQLARGSGVCGAIFRAAGRGLDEACNAIGHCDTGDAVATDAFDLPCLWVIHTVGPVYGHDRERDAALLASCYRRSLLVAAGLGARSVAFPAISTGVYGYPADDAAAIAVATVRGAAMPGIDRVVLVAFDDEAAERYQRLLDS